MSENAHSEPEATIASVGGIVATRIARVQVVHVRRPGRRRGGVSHEALRFRLTLERTVIEGRYLTMWHRAPGSVEPRKHEVHWQAVVPMPALQEVRQYWARQNRTGRRKGRAARTLVHAASALHEWSAPVNRYTLGAVMGLLTINRAVYVQQGRGRKRKREVHHEPVRLSHRWIQSTLKRSGWRTLRPFEYPKDAPGYAIANWVPGSK